MSAIDLKNDLINILNKVSERTSIEDLLKQISLLEDVYRSEQDIEKGSVFTQKEVDDFLKIS